MTTLFFKNRAASSLSEKPLPSLAMCLVMDLIGYATYIIPLFGEVLDLFWAPVSALIFMRMFGGRKGLFGGIFNFVEEILPGLDFIPTFTIMWLFQYIKQRRNTFTVQSASANHILKY